MENRKFFFLIFLLIAFAKNLNGQDFQYSQPFESSMYLNPAFTGSSNFRCNGFKDWFHPANIRIASLSRSQWKSRFISNYTGIEHTVIGSNWAFGTFVQNDQLTNTKFNTQYLALLTSYTFSQEDIMFRFGYQLGIGRRFLGQKNFDFGDEFNGSGFNLSTTGEDPSVGQSISYLDFSSIGINLRKGLLSIGFSAHHLTKPKISVWGGSDKLNRKFSVQIIKGIELQSFKESGRKASDYLYFVSTFKNQGGSNQLDLGAYLEVGRRIQNHHFQTISVGGWFRGIPVKSAPDNEVQRDVVVVQGAWQRDLLRVSYSYDIPVSKAQTFGHSHEISISFQYSNGQCRDKRPPPLMPCNHETRKSKRGGIKVVWRALTNIFS
jgi:type IX secretion system PorP/SprF family membrane protein